MLENNFSVHTFLESFATKIQATYTSDTFQSEVQIKNTKVEGRVEGIQIDEDIALIHNKLYLNDPIAFPSFAKSGFFKFSFYLNSNYKIRNRNNVQAEHITTGLCRGYIFKEPVINRVYPLQKEVESIDVVIRLSIFKKIIEKLDDRNVALRLMGYLEQPANRIFRGSIWPKLHQLLLDVWQNEEAGLLRYFSARAKVYELIYEVLKNADELIQEKKQESFLRQEDIGKLYDAKNYLSENYIKPPTIKELSRIVCLNEFKLKKGFKCMFNCTVHNYLVNKRMEISCSLLKKQGYSVEQIAMEVGYQCTSKFICAFKQRYGVTPGNFRKLAS